MRAFHCAAIAVSAVLCAVLFTGCETSDDASNTSTAGDVDSGTQSDADSTGDVTVDEDVTSLTDLGESDTIPPDAGPPGPDRSISPLAKISVCADICENAMVECAGSIPFPDVETCQQVCETDLEADPTHLTNWSCAQQSCDADLCGFGDDGIQTAFDAHPGCIEACGLLDACGAYEAVNLPPSEIGVCISVCTASAIADATNTDPDHPGFQVILECITDALTDGCDEDATAACVAPPAFPPTGSQEHTDWCSSLCGTGDGPPEMQEKCDPDTPLMMAYSDDGQCIEDCLQGSIEQSFVWWGCLATSDCQDPSGCQDVSSEISGPCEEACNGLFDACPEGGSDMTDELSCTYLCTGYEMNAGPFKGGGEQCMLDAANADDSGTFCDEDGPSGGAMGVCLLEPSEACVELCGELAPCIAEPGSDPEQAMLDCALGCQIGGMGESEEVSACVDAANGDCEASIACLGGPDGPNPEAVSASDLCAYACGMLDGDQDDPEDTGCEPDSPAKLEMPDFLKCMEGCTMTNDPGQAMATLACLAVSDCGKAMGTVSHCIDYPIEVLPSCEPACETADELCTEEVAGGPYCPEFCTGATMNIENLASTEDVAACMDAVDTCEDDGFGYMLMCHIEPPEHCAATCGALDTCGMDDDGGCMDGCAIGYLGQSVEDPFPACVAQADGDCAAMGECWALVIPPGQDP